MADDKPRADDQQPLLSNPTDDEPPKKDGKILLLAFLAMVVFGSANKILNKLSTIPMARYSMSLSVLSTGVYLLSFIYIWINPRGVITPKMKAIPKYKFAILGALDSMSGVMQLFATAAISSGALVVLLQQAAIPASLIISRVFLKAEYQTRHYIGASIVVVGLIIVLIPTFIHPSGGAPVQWIVVMLLSCIPMCFSSVAKEKLLGDVQLDVVFVNGWIALFQLFIGFAFMPAAGAASHIEPADLPRNLIDGFKCYAGINSVHVSTSNYAADDCSRAPLYVTAYMAANLVFNVLIIVILQQGSSNILWLALTTLVPISAFVFAIPGMPAGAKVSVYTGLGLVLILTGLFIYRCYGIALEYYNKYRGIETESDARIEEREDVLANSSAPISISYDYEAASAGGGDIASSTRSIALTPAISFLGSGLEVGLASGVVSHRVRMRNAAIAQSLVRTHGQVRGGYFSRLGIPAPPPGSSPTSTMGTINQPTTS